MAGMWETAALQAGLNTFTAGANSLFGMLNAKKIAKLNYKYNEMAANNADARARALYNDLESPMATIKQLREAGLSPSLYAGGNVGGSIGANGAQGQGTSGVSFPNGMMSPIDIATMQVQEAQARYLNAEADELEGKNPMGQAKIADLFSSAGLKDQQKLYTQTLDKKANLEADILDESKPFILAKTKHEAKVVENNAEKLFWEAQNEYFEFSLNVETAEEQKKLIDAQVKELISRTALNYSQKKLNEEEITALINYVNVAIDQAQTAADNAATYGEYVENLKNNMEKELELRAKEINLDAWRIGVNAFTDIVCAGLHTWGLASFKSKGMELTEHTTSFDKNGNITGSSARVRSSKKR